MVLVLNPFCRSSQTVIRVLPLIVLILSGRLSLILVIFYKTIFVAQHICICFTFIVRNTIFFNFTLNIYGSSVCIFCCVFLFVILIIQRISLFTLFIFIFIFILGTFNSIRIRVYSSCLVFVFFCFFIFFCLDVVFKVISLIIFRLIIVSIVSMISRVFWVITLLVHIVLFSTKSITRLITIFALTLT